MISMTSLQKKLAALIVILTLGILSLDVAIYRAFYINPNHFRTTYQTIRSPKIPESMDQVSMVYISDLEYGSFSSPEQTDQIFTRIRELNPDLFIYGGDLFASDYTVTDADKDQMTAWLSAIPAPLGKFAVWGEQDLVNEGRMQNVSEICSRSEVEILDNTSRLVANQSRDGIRLCAFGLNLNPETALAGTSPDQFGLAVSHYPDNLLADAAASAPLDLALAGNAHGTQITWPIKGGYRLWPGSEKLNRADQKSLPFDYYLTSGLGCVNIKARLNAPVEIVYLMFEHS